ncbi:GNAT family N-acetyltransferase [Leifsonia shinshuensis]|uniref:GNAT family N-acetyltransferase n=1 Tax=Leifsonia shinshuensis TaxID=150026 RepID=UPI002856A0DA|nr:GNAT family N-acetyltransferase [Leifsonia shinshuensis]MDR6970647.1 RimJ/RimL family protein N-acetyltransferase [Leifsonia shinshuensis]
MSAPLLATRLRTPRLVLDTPTDDDIPDVLAACLDAETQRWVPLPSPYTRESAEFFVRSYCPHGLASRRYTVWALHERSGGRMLGALEVRRDERAGSASLGCWSGPWARGRGFMREALSAVARHALDPDGLGLTSLNWEYVPGNDASRRLAEAVGFDFGEGMRTLVSLHGEPREARVGTLRRDDVRR